MRFQPNFRRIAADSRPVRNWPDVSDGRHSDSLHHGL